MIQLLDPALQSQIAFVLSLTSTVLGFAVGYLALKGYFQSGKRPMLFIAAGFVLVFWTPVLLLVGPLVAPAWEFTFGMLGELSQVLGLASILYGLWMPDRSA